MSKQIQRYDDFVNEAIDLSFFKAVPILSKALLDGFARSVAPEVKKLMDADLNNEKTWMDPYRKIFQKACTKFGGAKPDDINGTCNKAQALQGMAVHLFDPKKGLLNAKEVTKWVDEATKGKSPGEVTYEWTPKQIDPIVIKFVEVLKRTGITAGDLKKTGTYLLTMGIPVMLKFYKAEDLLDMKMLTDNQLIDAKKAEELINGGAKGGDISLS
jgi:hypothetical protein